MGEDETPVGVEVAPRDLAMLLYTSGTTGPSKGCMITHNHICNFGVRQYSHIGVRHEDVYWTPVPLFHMAGTGGAIGALQFGCTLSIFPRFSLSAFWPEIERSGATIVLLFSAMLNFVADAPDNAIAARCHGQIRTVHGIPFSTALQEKWKRRFGVRYAGIVAYGMTETGPITLTNLQQPAPPGSSGQRYGDYEVQIVDDHDQPLPEGSSGEVVARPRLPNIMFKGYWGRPQATVDVTRNLWFHTGDIGRFDEHGFLHFIDRKKDYLRRRGENISSYEMEVTFQAHPAIKDVAVHAVPSDSSEDEVKVTAILNAGSDLTPYELCQWCIPLLPAFAVPRYIEFRADFPRNGTGKVLKYELRAQGVTARTWDRNASDLQVGQRKRTANP